MPAIPLPRRVLVVDDDPDFGESLLDVLELRGFEAVVAPSADAAAAALGSFDPPVAMLDIRLGGASGVDLLPRLQRDRPALVCVMITAHADIASAIDALRQGAYDYIDKSCSPDELVAVLDRAFERHRLTADHRAAVEALRQAKEAAESASRAKTDFLATMSHELRTPLNAIIGFSEMILAELMGPLGSPRYRDYLQDINSSGHHLLAIINDILDLTRVELGRLELTESIVHPGDTVSAIQRLMAPRAAQAGLTLVSHIDGDVPRLRLDEQKLRQILLNLVSNAVKFTPAGGRIEIRAYVAGDGHLAVAVADTGIGIPGNQLARVVEPFVQIDSSLARRHEGTGLGLPLAKAFAELHGGRLELASEPGVGTTATIILPCRQPDGV